MKHRKRAILYVEYNENLMGVDEKNVEMQKKSEIFFSTCATVVGHIERGLQIRIVSFCIVLCEVTLQSYTDEYCVINTTISQTSIKPPLAFIADNSRRTYNP